MNVLLVGCVKAKHDVDRSGILYKSALFSARRSWARAQQGRWFIVREIRASLR